MNRVKNDQLMQLGWLAFQDGHIDNAAAYAAEARTRHPILLRTGGTELAAWTCFAQGNLTEALSAIEELDTPGPFLGAAQMLHAGSGDEAAASLAAALLGAPDVTGRSALVSESIRTGHLESAIEELLQHHGQAGLAAATSVESLLVRQGNASARSWWRNASPQTASLNRRRKLHNPRRSSGLLALMG